MITPNVRAIRVATPPNKIVKINVVEGGGGGGGVIPDTPVSPHYFLGGPASGFSAAIPVFRPLVPADIPFAPTLTDPNVFTNVNRIPGLRVNAVVRTANFTLGVTDFENFVDASAGQVDAVLPQALGTGQIYRVKKGDQTPNLVNVTAAPGDLIDGDTYVPLRVWKDELVVIDAALQVWDRFNVPTPDPPDLTDYARLSISNEFTAPNTFHGLGLSPRVVSTDGETVSSSDTEILVDATDGDFSLFLPPSSGLGSWYHIKKVDTTNHVVSIIADGTDSIDGSISVNLEEQWADCTLVDGQVGYWDNVGAGPVQTVPTVFQIGQWARFIEMNSPNGLGLEIFDGANWVLKWSVTL